MDEKLSAAFNSDIFCFFTSVERSCLSSFRVFI